MIPSSGSPAGDTSPKAGFVVEDYSYTVIDSSELGRGWAPMLRWAITLDGGRLVYAAEGGLELA